MDAGLVETTSTNTKMRTTKKINIKNLPSDTTKEEVDEIIKKYAGVKTHKLVHVGKEVVLEITFDSDVAASITLDDLKNFSYRSNVLQAEWADKKSGSPSFMNKPFLQRIPLRMLVSTQYVGAIIGKKGVCVRNIATKCKARIDVHSKDSTGGAEKVISIYGQPEKRTEACSQVLQVLCAEGAFSSKNEVVLRLLAGDMYSGRLIGKEGRHIRKVRELSNAKINIVLSHELSSFYPDRVVMMRGSLQEVAAAEALVSSKLAACYEADATKSQAMLSTSAYLSGKMFLHPFFPPAPSMKLPPMHPVSNYAYGDGFHQAPLPVSEQLQVLVPASSVGSLIGEGGSVIKQMMRNSGAFLCIERTEGRAGDERMVCIRGAVEACCRALFCLFERMRLEGFSGPGESRLKVLMSVPGEVVGRLIGKGGCNIRSLQKLTGAIVRVAPPTALLTPPTTASTTASTTVPTATPTTTAATPVVAMAANDNMAAKGDNNEKRRPDEDVKKTQANVQLFGNFAAVMNAHVKIRNMVQLTTIENFNKQSNTNSSSNTSHYHHNRVYYNHNFSKPPRNK